MRWIIILVLVVVVAWLVMDDKCRFAVYTGGGAGAVVSSAARVFMP